MQYIVDVLKPPIGPPIRAIKMSFGVDVEMKESLAQTKVWKSYMTLYREALAYSRKPKPPSFSR